MVIDSVNNKKENYFFEKSNSPYFTKDFKAASYFCHQAIKINYKFRPAYFRLGNIAFVLMHYDEAFEYYKKFLFYSKKAENYSDISKAYNSIGSFYLKKEQFTEALKFYHLSLIIDKKYKKASDIARSYNNIALTYRVKKDFKKALYFYKLALSISFKELNKIHVAYCYFNITMMYKEKKQYFRAFFYLKKFKRIKEILKETGIYLNPQEHNELK